MPLRKKQPQPKNPTAYRENEEPKLGDAVWMRTSDNTLTSAHIIRVVPREYRTEYDFVAVPFDEDEAYTCKLRDLFKYRGVKAKYHNQANAWIRKQSKYSPDKWSEWIHEDECAHCKKEGEQVMCDSCIASYHPSCAGLQGRQPPRIWHCPICIREFQKDQNRQISSSTTSTSSNSSSTYSLPSRPTLSINSTSSYSPPVPGPAPLAQKRPPKKKRRLSEQAIDSFVTSRTSSATSPSLPAPSYMSSSPHFSNLEERRPLQNQSQDSLSRRPLEIKHEEVQPYNHSNQMFQLANNCETSNESATTFGEVRDLSCAASSSPSSTQTSDSNQDNSQSNNISELVDFNAPFPGEPGINKSERNISNTPINNVPVREEGIKLLCKAKCLPCIQHRTVILCKQYGDLPEDASPILLSHQLTLENICNSIKKLWKVNGNIKLFLVLDNGDLLSILDDGYLKSLDSPLVFEFKVD